MRRFLLIFLVLGIEVNCGEFYSDLDVLYWKPVIPSVLAGRRIGPNGGGVRPRENLLISGSNGWGVRPRIGYKTGTYFADLAYLYYCSGNSESFSANPPSTVIRMPAGTDADDLSFLRSRLNFRYQNLDGRLGHYLINRKSHALYVYANGRWVDILFSNRDRGIRSDAPVGAVDTYTQQTRFQGGGVGAGFGGEYQLFSQFRLNGLLGVLAVTGNIDPKAEMLASTGDFSIKTDQNPNAYILPAVEFRLGIDYQLCLYGLLVNAGVGYELDYYFNVIRHNIGGTDRDATDDAPHLKFYGAGFGGPYLRLGVSY